MASARAPDAPLAAAPPVKGTGEAVGTGAVELPVGAVAAATLVARVLENEETMSFEVQQVVEDDEAELE